MMTQHEKIRQAVYRLSARYEMSQALRIDIVRLVEGAINDKLEEVAKEIELLEQGHYTTAQTPAGLVRKMREE